MGFIDDINALNLDDSEKQKLIAAHQGEVDPLKSEVGTLKAKDRKESVEAEVTALGAMFSDDPEKKPVGLIKFYRRVLLSPDSHEPGAVLLSDNELGLSGDQATGSTGKEEVSAAHVLREFVKLFPVNSDGKVELTDQITASGDHGRPSSGGSGDDLTPEEQAAERKAKSSRIAGRPVDRAASRSKRYGTATVGAGS